MKILKTYHHIGLIFILSLFFYQVCPVKTSRRSLAAIQKRTPGLKKELQEKSLMLGSPVFIRIFKLTNELEVWIKKDNQFILFKNYKICYYSGQLGPKLAQGDLQAPEGFYFVIAGRMNPWSSFHLSFDIGYPNRYDRFHKRTGGNIAIHGDCVSIGCFAMTDVQIEEIFTLTSKALDNGQSYFRVHIFPFRMTEENMASYASSPWLNFWKNLKTGFDYFESKKIPPDVSVRNGEYIFK